MVDADHASSQLSSDAYNNGSTWVRMGDADRVRGFLNLRGGEEETLRFMVVLQIGFQQFIQFKGKRARQRFIGNVVEKFVWESLVHFGEPAC